MAGAKNASGRKAPYELDSGGGDDDSGSHRDQIAALRKLLTTHHADDIVAATRMLRDIVIGNPELERIIAAGTVDEDGEMEESKKLLTGWSLFIKNPRLWREMYNTLMDRTIGRPVNPVEATQGGGNAFGILGDLKKLSSDGTFVEIQGVAFQAITHNPGSSANAGDLEMPQNGHNDPQGLRGESLLPPRLVDESEEQQEGPDRPDPDIG